MKKHFLRILKKMLCPVLVPLLRVYMWLLFITSRVQTKINTSAQEALVAEGPLILAIWHSRLLLFPHYLAKFGKFKAIVSSHMDGDLLSSFLAIYGHGAIRGSSRRDSFMALKQAISTLRNKGVVVITPDGPLGPKLHINSNICAIASKTDSLIIPMCYSCTHALRLKSWDRLVIPLPFSLIVIELMEPLSPSIGSMALQSLMQEQLLKLDIQTGLVGR